MSIDFVAKIKTFVEESSFIHKVSEYPLVRGNGPIKVGNYCVVEYEYSNKLTVITTHPHDNILVNFRNTSVVYTIFKIFGFHLKDGELEKWASTSKLNSFCKKSIVYKVEISRVKLGVFMVVATPNF